jgi:hypothetical protein
MVVSVNVKMKKWIFYSFNEANLQVKKFLWVRPLEFTGNEWSRRKDRSLISDF